MPAGVHQPTSLHLDTPNECWQSRPPHNGPRVPRPKSLLSTRSIQVGLHYACTSAFCQMLLSPSAERWSWWWGVAAAHKLTISQHLEGLCLDLQLFSRWTQGRLPPGWSSGIDLLTTVPAVYLGSGLISWHSMETRLHVKHSP